jgi:hypothetical protein
VSGGETVPVRVFVAATVPLLRTAVAARSLPIGPSFAVTPALQGEYPDAGEDELEDEVRELAASASLELVERDPEAPYRRVVVVVEGDASPADKGPGAVPGAVTLAGPQPLPTWSAALLDAPGLNAADGVEDRELLWYGVQELAHEL